MGGRLTDELEALRQYGRVTANTFFVASSSSSSSSSSCTDANNAANYNSNIIAIITPESEAERLRNKTYHEKVSRLDALDALRNVKYCGEEALQLRSLYRSVVNEQRVRREEAERNIREWRGNSKDLMLGGCAVNGEAGGDELTSSYWEEEELAHQEAGEGSMEDGVRRIPYDSNNELLLSYEAMKHLLVRVTAREDIDEGSTAEVYNVDDSIVTVEPYEVDKTNAKDAQPKGPLDDVIEALCMQIEQLRIDEEDGSSTLQPHMQCYSKNGDLIFWSKSSEYSTRENGTTT